MSSSHQIRPTIGPSPPRRDWVVRATSAGRKAQEVWRPLFGVIEKRWEDRFGKHKVDALRESLRALAGQIDVELSDGLPIIGYGLFSKALARRQRTTVGPENEAGAQLILPSLLSRVLLAFAIEFEDESELSLAISTNALRVLNEKVVPIRDLPKLTGVSKELMKVSIGFLEKQRYVSVEADAKAKGAKLVRLTAKGREAQDGYRRLVELIEKRWQMRFGNEAIKRLRDSLELLVGEPTPELSPLFRGLQPYPDGWRASVRQADTLPHYPVVTHRGGFPDGS